MLKAEEIKVKMDETLSKQDESAALSNWNVDFGIGTLFDNRFVNSNKSSILHKIAFRSVYVPGDPPSVFNGQFQVFLKFNKNEKSKDCIQSLLLLNDKISMGCPYEDHFSSIFEKSFETDTYDDELVVKFSIKKNLDSMKIIGEFLNYIHLYIENIYPNKAMESMKGILERERSILFFHTVVRAAYEGDLKKIQELFEFGKIDANLRRYGDYGDTLISACSRGKFECVRYLIEECGAKITPVSEYNYSPLKSFMFDNTRPDMRVIEYLFSRVKTLNDKDVTLLSNEINKDGFLNGPYTLMCSQYGNAIRKMADGAFNNRTKVTNKNKFVT